MKIPETQRRARMVATKMTGRSIERDYEFKMMIKRNLKMGF